MRARIILLGGMIIGILLLVLFGPSIKEKALNGIIRDIPEYNCGDGNLCTSCIIGGHSCSCGKHICTCGNETIDKAECELFG
jgi:hypothetical protein